MGFATAFPSLYRAQTAARGETVTADFGTDALAEVPVIIGDIGDDTALYPGGIGQQGTVSIQVLKSTLDDAGYTIAKNASVTLTPGSLTLSIVGEAQNKGGVYLILLGDPVTR